MMMLPCVLVAARFHNKSFHGARVDVALNCYKAQKSVFELIIEVLSTN